MTRHAKPSCTFIPARAERSLFCMLVITRMHDPSAPSSFSCKIMFYVVVHHPGNMQGYGGAVGNYIALINFPTPSCVPAQSPCG